MSYQLAFWRGESILPVQKTYESLMSEAAVNGVAEVDPGVVFDTCRARFPGWAQNQNLWIQDPDADGNGPGFDLHIGTQLVSFTCYGVDHGGLNAIIDAMNDLGYPLYDPQTDERFGLG